MTVAVADDRLATLLARRSVSPRRLGPPGPTDAEIAAAVGAGLRAPDHGGLVPWRVVVVPPSRRAALADAFVDEKRRRVPQASPDDLARAAAHATDPPALLAFVVALRPDADVPAHEQWLAAGAALMNILNAFHALGFGAIVLSGERCADEPLARALGVEPPDRLAGFLSVGRIAKAPSAAPAKPLDRVLSVWNEPLPMPQGAPVR